MRMINPTIDNKYVLAVPMSLSGKWNICANTTSAAMDASAKKKDGIPILNMDTNEICEGFKGYEKELMIEKIAKNKENIFLYRNRVAERVMLLISRLPSETISLR